MRKLCLVLIAVGLAGCGTGARLQSMTIGGGKAIVAIPHGPLSGAVLYVHGVGGDRHEATSNPLVGRVTTPLLQAGYVVASSDAALRNWGNPAGVRQNVALGRYLKRYGALFILSDSMGGLIGLQSIPMLHPKAWVGIAPVCNLRAVYERYPAFDSQVAQAWGRAEPMALSKLSPVALRDVRGLPMLFFVSPQDQIVPPKADGELCATRARSAGALVTLTYGHGPHTDPSVYQGSQVVRFLNGALRDG